MEAAILIGFYLAVAVVVIRLRRFNLALAAAVLAGMLAVALIVQATLSPKWGGYAALGLVMAVVIVLVAMRFGAEAAGEDKRRPPPTAS